MHITLCDRGSSLQRRLKEREKEMEADERDRQREREEMEEIRRRLMEEGHPDPEAEMARVSSLNDEVSLILITNMYNCTCCDKSCIKLGLVFDVSSRKFKFVLAAGL